METKTLTFRKAAASDLDAVTAIYDRLHAQEDAGRVTIGWVTGVYPIRFDAEQALARGDLYVCESEGRVAASGILNQRQVDVYTEGRWAYAAEGGASAARSCNSMRIRRERWAAPCCGWIPTKKTLPRGAYTRGSATGRRTSCRARSTAFRMCGSCCSKRSYNF